MEDSRYYEKKLLNNTKKLQQQQELLDRAILTLDETNNIATDSLQRLVEQRHHIVNINNTNYDLDSSVSGANRIIKRMESSSLKNKVCLIFLIMIIMVIIIAIIIFVIYSIYDKYLKNE